MAIHDFDMARWLLDSDEPKEAFATGSALVHPDLKGRDIDTASIVLRTATGCMCTILNCRRAADGYDQRVQVFGQNGAIQADNPTNRDLAGHKGFFTTRYEQAYCDAIHHFLLRVIPGHEAPLATCEDGLRALLCAQACASSLQAGKAVDICHPTTWTDMTWPRWVVVGTGTIARQFVAAVRLAHKGYVAAVVSRDRQRGEAFAREFCIPLVFVGHDHAQWLARTDLDVAYIASPHTSHAEHIEMCLEHKKHVLCEKPLCPNPEEARRLQQLAARHGVFLMEGMWMKCFPAFRKMLALVVEEQRIGTLTKLQVEHAFAGGTRLAHDNRLVDPALGGGALLDIGVYILALADSLVPSAEVGRVLLGQCELHPVTDVETSLDFEIEFRAKPGPVVLQASCSIDRPGSNTAILHGTHGQLVLEAPYHCPHTLRLQRHGEKEQVFHEPYVNGLQYEIQEFVRHVDGSARTGSAAAAPWASLDSSIRVLHVLEMLRKRVREAVAVGGGHEPSISEGFTVVRALAS
jgi:predicted dehydrogenase